MYFWKKDTFLLVYLTVMTLAAQEGNIFATNFTSSTTGISSTTVEDSTSESTQTTSVSESSLSPTTERTSTSEVTSSTTVILSTTVENSTSKQTQTTSVSESSPSPTTEGTSTSEVTSSTTGISLITVEDSTSKQTQTTSVSESSPSPTTEGIRTSKVTEFTTKITCQDCDCNGSPCFFNPTTEKCQCQCKPPTFGDKCNFVTGSSPADLSGNTPTRKAKISLRLKMDFLPAYGNVNSPQYKNLAFILKREVSILCRRADDRNFKDVNITNLRPGSVIADSIAEYNYPNNNTQIQFLNKDLERTLESIFHDSESFRNLSAALGSVSIENPNITTETPEIFNITGLQEYVRCTEGFANFTAELVDDEWVCVGPCEKDPNYCSKRGQCFNEINGSQCQCDRSNFEEYYGTNCELYRRGAAFYAALFGSLAAFIVIVIVIVVVVLRFRSSSSKTSF
ncbi:uncharacterized protein [Misgurnus anguillicaudatus]|uniref:uncharacterized protein n=1 Tax=Misgurnus anguillicaudatus TaxID=75329 RepID=UPI003CCF988C